jgi:hypothetical protein
MAFACSCLCLSQEINSAVLVSLVDSESTSTAISHHGLHSPPLLRQRSEKKLAERGRSVDFLIFDGWDGSLIKAGK